MWKTDKPMKYKENLCKSTVQGEPPEGLSRSFSTKSSPTEILGARGPKPLGVVCATSEAEEIVAKKTVFHGFCDFLHRIRGLTCG